ncbi:hypothetical protein GC248_12940 [Acetobacter senegalensis]|nr:hypothetical protein [Acetobacter senegalensis]
MQVITFQEFFWEFDVTGFQEMRCVIKILDSDAVAARTDSRRGNLTEGLYIGLDYEKVCFSQKNFS